MQGTSQKNRPIKVGIDIRDLRVAKTGQKTVTEELCKQFASFTDPELEFVFFDSSFSIYRGRKKWRILIEHMRYQYWKQVVLPIKAWRKNCDILFVGDYFAPYVHLGYKTVEIFYDAFFFEYPEHYNKSWLHLFHKIAMPAARRCEKIMTITEYSKNKLHTLAGFPLEKLVTIYPAHKTVEPLNLPDHALAKHVASGRKYILHVGVMEKRKNIASLVKAFHLFVQNGYDDIDLVLVGSGTGNATDDTAQIHKAIKDCDLSGRVIFTGYLPDQEVAEIYKHAFLYVFPSINEGFGIPILEAFRFNVPVIVANNSCLTEVGGDAVLSFDPYNIDELCDKMRQVTDNPELRADLISKGSKRLLLFSWEKAARDLAGVFKQVAKTGS